MQTDQDIKSIARACCLNCKTPKGAYVYCDHLKEVDDKFDITGETQACIYYTAPLDVCDHPDCNYVADCPTILDCKDYIPFKKETDQELMAKVQAIRDKTGKYASFDISGTSHSGGDNELEYIYTYLNRDEFDIEQEKFSTREALVAHLDKILEE